MNPTKVLTSLFALMVFMAALVLIVNNPTGANALSNASGGATIGIYQALSGQKQTRT